MKRNAELAKSLETTRQELFVKNHELLSVKKQLDQANATMDELAFEKRKFKNYKQNSELFSKQEQDNFAKEINELRTKNNEMQRRIEYLNDTNNAQLNLNEINLKKQDILKEIDALNKQKESVTIDYNNLRTKIAEKENILKEIDALNKQKDSDKINYSNLRTKIADLMKIKGKISQEIDALNKHKESETIDFNNLRTKIAVKENLLKTINAQNKQKESDTIDYNNLQTKIADLIRIKDKISQEIDALNKQKESVTIDYNNLRTKIAKNYSYFEILMAQNKQKVTDKKIAEKENILKEIDALNKRKESVTAVYDNLRTKIAEKENIIKEIDAFNKLNEAVTINYRYIEFNKCTEVFIERGKLRERNRKIAEKENILKEIDALNKQKESVTADYDNLRTKIAEKENIMKEIDAFNKQKELDIIDFNNLHFKITDLKTIKDVLSGEIDELKEMKMESSKQLEEFRVINSVASEEIDKLNDKKVDMLRQINRLDKRLLSADPIMNIWSPKNLTYSITSLMPSHLITDCNSLEFNVVKEQFMKSTQNHFQVHKVQKINNPHLRAMKILRVKEHELLHGNADVSQMLLYRAFKMNPRKLAECSFLDIIQRYGFIKFSKISNHECHKCQIIGEWKCMVVSSVIVCDRCQSKPPTSTGTSVDYGKIKSMSVNVYREDMFYPEYLLYFSGETIAQTKSMYSSTKSLDALID